jgi:hypothetical protein
VLRYARTVTVRDLFLQQIPTLSEADAAVLLALVQRLRAHPEAREAAPATEGAEATRPNMAPMAGSIRFLGDVESPIGEAWEADS